MGAAVERGKQAGREARRSTTMRTAARVGLGAYGVVHLLIAWIALRIAWSGGGDASTGGAMRTVAKGPLGSTALWLAAAGLAGLTIWQIMTALWGFESERDARKRATKRLTAAGRALVYVTLAGSAARTAAGSGSSSGSDSQERGLTARLMSEPAGRILVALVAVGIVVVAARQLYRGLSDNFTHDLNPSATSGPSGSAILAVGRIGYVGKGVAVGAVGILFGWAAITYDPNKAGGLDQALKTVRDQPFGPYLLTLVAVGLAAFGLFCFAWARYVRTR